MQLVGRTPPSAPDPQVRLFHGDNRLIRSTKERGEGVPRGRGRPPYQRIARMPSPRGRLWAIAMIFCMAVGAQESPPKAPLGLPPVPWPADNPYSAARVELGRYLFFDPRLSANGAVSCATCHPPAHAVTGGDPAPIGVTGTALPRRAPTLINRLRA